MEGPLKAVCFLLRAKKPWKHQLRQSRIYALEKQAVFLCLLLVSFFVCMLNNIESEDCVPEQLDVGI